MPLQIKIDGERARPVITCDHCGEEIEDARNGNYEWPVDGKGNPIKDRIYYTHKKCCHAFEKTNNEASWCAIELQWLPIFLINNLKVDQEEVKKSLKIFGNI